MFEPPYACGNKHRQTRRLCSSYKTDRWKLKGCFVYWTLKKSGLVCKTPQNSIWSQHTKLRNKYLLVFYFNIQNTFQFFNFCHIFVGLNRWFFTVSYSASTNIQHCIPCPCDFYVSFWQFSQPFNWINSFKNETI